MRPETRDEQKIQMMKDKLVVELGMTVAENLLMSHRIGIRYEDWIEIVKHSLKTIALASATADAEVKNMLRGDGNDA